MRVVSLSDHPAAMLRNAQQRRLAAERDAGLAYQDVLAVHGQHVTHGPGRAGSGVGPAPLGRVAARRLCRPATTPQGPAHSCAGERAYG